MKSQFVKTRISFPAWSLLLYLFFLPVKLPAQTLVNIYGVIRDTKSQLPLPCVTVTLPETKISVVSDARGRFSMVNNSPGMLLAISVEGYKTAFLNFLPGKMYYCEISLQPNSDSKGKVLSKPAGINRSIDRISTVKATADSSRTRP
jgi:hypothetical protein